MKRTLILLLLPFCALAQKEVQVSEDYTATLIFPSQIDMSILGNEQEYYIKPSTNTSAVAKSMLSVSYIKIDNVEKNTNLVVFTKDGNSYSFSLKYVKKPNKLDPYYIAVGDRSNKADGVAVGPETTTVEVKDSYYTRGVVTQQGTDLPTVPNLKGAPLYTEDKIAYIEGYCREHNGTPKRIFKTYDKSDNIKLTLKEISFDRDELYFHFSISNNGGQAFDVDFMNTKLSRDYKGVSTDQNIPLTPLYIFNKPTRVKGRAEEDFTMVFKKFTINDKKEFQIDLAEKEGERDLLLHINSNIINNPTKL